MQNEKKQQAEKLETDIILSILGMEKQFEMARDKCDFIFTISLGISFGFGRLGNRVMVFYSHAFSGMKSKFVQSADEAMVFFKDNGLE